jgi:hypothetical protein
VWLKSARLARQKQCLHYNKEQNELRPKAVLGFWSTTSHKRKQDMHILKAKNRQDGKQDVAIGNNTWLWKPEQITA